MGGVLVIDHIVLGCQSALKFGSSALFVEWRPLDGSAALMGWNSPRRFGLRDLCCRLLAFCRRPPDQPLPSKRKTHAWRGHSEHGIVCELPPCGTLSQRVPGRFPAPQEAGSRVGLNPPT